MRANTKNLISFFFELGTLRKVSRAHQQTLLTQDLSDNIASHSFRTAFIGYFIAKEVGTNPEKVLIMCLLHDIEESRSGDQNWIHKKYIKVFEEEIRKEQMEKLEHARDLLKLSKEYEERKTLEAKVAKDADLLDQMMILKEYYWQGNQEAKDWLKIDGKARSEQEKLMFTKTAKDLANEIKRQNPSDWWTNFWTSKRR